MTDSATISAARATVVTGAPSVTATARGLSGSVNPGGLATTASFQYGLDPKYSGGGGPLVYTNSTPTQNVGSDFATHIVSASVSGLVPNALYHVRLVATNAAGPTFGPDVTFTTAKAPAPGSPALGKTVNISLVSGLVLVEIHGVFVPLTELTQIPTNTEINALKGSIKLITAINGGPASGERCGRQGQEAQAPDPEGHFRRRDLQAPGPRAPARARHARDRRERFLRGTSYASAPRTRPPTPPPPPPRPRPSSYSTPAPRANSAPRATSAATVLGTKWTIADRCNGTLTHDITDSVEVTDFVRHKTVILHAGQSYLAKKP